MDAPVKDHQQSDEALDTSKMIPVGEETQSEMLTTVATGGADEKPAASTTVPPTQCPTLTRAERKARMYAAFSVQFGDEKAARVEPAAATCESQKLLLERLNRAAEAYEKQRREPDGTDLYRSDLSDIYGVDPELNQQIVDNLERNKLDESQSLIRSVYRSVVKTIVTFMMMVLDPYVLMSTAFGLLSVVLCAEIKWTADLNFTLFTLPIVFPLTMAISSSYGNKMKFLQDMAVFKTNLVTYYYLEREFAEDTGLGSLYLQHNLFLLRSITLCMMRYLTTKDEAGRASLVTALYGLFSKLAESNDLLRMTGNAQIYPTLYIRLVQNQVALVETMEKIRCARDYKTPRTLRCYTKMFVFCTPFLCGPIFAVTALKNGYLAALYGAGLTTFIFATLQRIQDGMDDFFDMNSPDDIDLSELGNWFDSVITELRVLTKNSTGRNGIRLAGAPKVLKPVLSSVMNMGRKVSGSKLPGTSANGKPH